MVYICIVDTVIVYIVYTYMAYIVGTVIGTTRSYREKFL